MRGRRRRPKLLAASRTEPKPPSSTKRLLSAEQVAANGFYIECMGRKAEIGRQLGLCVNGRYHRDMFVFERDYDGTAASGDEKYLFMAIWESIEDGLRTVPRGCQVDKPEMSRNKD
jgi:hypothetical protein